MIKKLISGLLLTLSLTFAASTVAHASYSQPLPNAECVDGRLVLYLNPQGVSKNVAVRVDNTSNGWGGDKPLAGDVVNNNVRNSAFVKADAEVGQKYVYWVHYIDSKGTYGPAIAGEIYCIAHSPVETTQVYEYPYLTLSWKPVKGAVRYGIRIDDTERSPYVYFPTPFKAEVGDRIEDNVQGTSYRFKVGEDRKFTWWVHAVDKNGVFSESSRKLTIRTN